MNETIHMKICSRTQFLMLAVFAVLVSSAAFSQTEPTNSGGVYYVKTFPTAPVPSGFDKFVGPRCMCLSAVCASTPSGQDFWSWVERVGYPLRRLQYCEFAKEWRCR